MGLSSSQARLLTLTSRMHDIEYKAAKLEAQKLQMANESRKVYEDYLVALDATKIQMKKIATDGSIDYVDATYNLLKNNGYRLTLKSMDKAVVSQSTADNFVRANGVREAFIALESGRVDSSFRNKTDGYYEVYSTQQFLALAASQSYSFSNVNCRLMSNIDLSSGFNQSMTISNCIFDGNGHSVTGLNRALFDTVSNSSTIKDLSISGNISNTYDRAILANTITNSSVEDVVVSGKLNHKGSQLGVGALVGTATNTDVTRCCAQNVTVENTINPTNATNKASRTGCLIGNISGTSNVTHCSSSGTVTGWSAVGGLIGRCVGTTVEYCSSSAICSATEPATCPTPGSDVGGLIGVASEGSNVSYSYSTGTVAGYRNSCGGLIGSDWGSGSTTAQLQVENCYTTCNVTAPDSGGFIGGAPATVIKNCSSSGTVTGSGTGTFIGTAGSLTNISNSYTPQPGDKIGYYVDTPAQESFAASDINLPAINVEQPKIKTNASANDSELGILFDEMNTKGYVIEGVNFDNPALGHEDDHVWFTNMVNAGELFISKYSKETGTYYDISVATDTSLQEVSDEKDLRKAEAKYEADMKKIDAKDKKYDTELAAIDNERNAVKSEMETLKTVAKDNVERTFKLFS